MRDAYTDENGSPLFMADIDKLHEEQDEKKKVQLRQWKMDFEDVFTGTPQGRRVLWWLMHETFVFRSFTQYNASAYAVLAKQELGQDIMSVLGAEKVLSTLIAVKKENPIMEAQDGS